MIYSLGQAQAPAITPAAWRPITTFAPLFADPAKLGGALDGRDASDYTLRRLYDPSAHIAVFFVPLTGVAELAREALRSAGALGNGGNGGNGRRFSVTSRPLTRNNPTLGRLIIRWQGGPTVEAVEAVVALFVGVSLSPDGRRQSWVAQPDPLPMFDRYGCVGVVYERQPDPSETVKAPQVVTV